MPASIKAKLHELIDSIDDVKVLEAIYVLLEYYKANNSNSQDDILVELEKREADHLAGKTNGYSLGEFKQRTSEKYGF